MEESENLVGDWPEVAERFLADVTRNWWKRAGAEEVAGEFYLFRRDEPKPLPLPIGRKLVDLKARRGMELTHDEDMRLMSRVAREMTIRLRADCCLMLTEGWFSRRTLSDVSEMPREYDEQHRRTRQECLMVIMETRQYRRLITWPILPGRKCGEKVFDATSRYDSDTSTGRLSRFFG